MKFTEEMIKQHLDTNADINTIAKSLTFLGLEVEEISTRNDLEPFVIAEIIEAVPHPSADKLRVCQVKTTEGILEIVCGAPNARAGIKVVLAPIGSKIPNGGFSITKSTIRGVASNGMLCSAEELNLGKDSEGIIEVPQEYPIGMKYYETLGLDKAVVELSITPNRGDALSMRGIARDLHAKKIGDLKNQDLPAISLNNLVNKKVGSNRSSVFYGVHIKGVSNKESPNWLKKELELLGQKSNGFLVDITNYVMMQIGQPMHAYDAKKVHLDSLDVVELESLTKVLALNGNEYDLPEGSLVVRDQSNLLALAGIIGFDNSKTDENTTEIILECANFMKDAVARTSQGLRLVTESSKRFERGVDYNLPLKALKYAVDLMSQEFPDLQIVGGVALKGEEMTAIEIDFKASDFHKRTGINNISIDEMIEILSRLGFGCNKTGENLKVTVPSWRYDVSIKEDLVEEILRVIGYDKVTPIEISVNNLSKDGKDHINIIKDSLVNRGIRECVHMTMEPLEKAEKFSNDLVIIENPISNDLAAMRSSLLHNLLKSALNNYNRKYGDLSLFEVGPVFKDIDGEAIKIENITGIRFGSNHHKTWYGNSRKFDVFDVKKDVEAIFDSLNLGEVAITNLEGEGAPWYYHPYICGSIKYQNNLCGMIGALHPQFLKDLDIDFNVYAFEIFDYPNNLIDKVRDKKNIASYIPSDYPYVVRDFCFILEEKTLFGDIYRFIKRINTKLIKDVNIFDLYQGANIEKGYKSIALEVVIESHEKTLTEEEINNISLDIINKVSSKFNATLRK